MGLDKAPSAVEKILECSKRTGNSTGKIRRSVAEALGTVSANDPLFSEVVNTLSHLVLNDNDGQVSLAPSDFEGEIPGLLLPCVVGKARWKPDPAHPREGPERFQQIREGIRHSGAQMHQNARGNRGSSENPHDIPMVLSHDPKMSILDQRNNRQAGNQAASTNYSRISRTA